MSNHTRDWRVVVSWKDNIDGLTEVKARAMFETLKRTLAEVSKGHDHPTIELRQGTIQRDFYEVRPK